MINDHIKDYEFYLLGEKKSKNTIKEYVYYVSQFIDYVKKDPEAIMREDIEKYKMHLAIDKKYSKNSIYLTIKAIQNFYKYLDLDTAKNISTPKRPRQLPKYLNEEETAKLLNVSSQNPRDHAILTTLAYTGLRVSELCNLKLSDIDFSDQVIRIRNGKGDKDRIVIIEEKVISSLGEYLKTRIPTEDYLFTTQKRSKISTVHVERIIKKYAKICGIRKKVTPHVLRHTLATTLLRNGADIRFIQQILGHSSIATTQIYTHVDDNALKDAYTKSKPNY